MSSVFHAKFWAERLLLSYPSDTPSALSRSISNSRVDLNPHQVDAALFALRSPFSKGVILADEVGLGKTIEACLVLAQRWAERKRRILLIVPATLRKQWQQELSEKFFLPSTILEAKTATALAKKGTTNPFRIEDKIIICSYQFAYSKRALLAGLPWDLVVIDEAHRLRSIYKETKTAVGIVDAVRHAPKMLLTATPLQNSLLELFGLISIVDPELFGSIEAFQELFIDADDSSDRDELLRNRIAHVCKRTLRKQVLEYIPFTKRFPLTADFLPSPMEQQLYDEVSSYLQRDVLVALPTNQRKLMTLVLRKLLASSSAAIGATLEKFVTRMKSNAPPAELEKSLGKDFESLDEMKEEWDEDEEPAGADQPERQKADAELIDLERFVALAKSVPQDAKATKLVEVLPEAFRAAQEKGAARKAVIFTESCKTQELLARLLNDSGYLGQVVLMNGSNSDAGSKVIYESWKNRHAASWDDITSGSKSADMKAAIVEEFKDRGVILLATESAAEGINLQFCSMIVNYDLPWNPQRVEQRIGRCHRYGQKSDVLVVNFVNRKNEADSRVFELLEQKFKLFSGVFGASDEVLGAVENGVDLEKRIAEIIHKCRTPIEITTAFDALQKELQTDIAAGMATTRKVLLENFDSDVHARLKVHKEKAKEALDAQQQMLLDLSRFSLGTHAVFSENESRFRTTVDAAQGEIGFNLNWQSAELHNEQFFRIDHPLAQQHIHKALASITPSKRVRFIFDSSVSALAGYVGKRGWLDVTKVNVSCNQREEQLLVISACDSAGVPLVSDVAEKLFLLKTDEISELSDARSSAFDSHRNEQIAEATARLKKRNVQFFDEEVLKFEGWADDKKQGLERELKGLDAEISSGRKAAKLMLSLAEKLDAQRRVKALELKRTQRRKDLFEAQDKIENEHDRVIDETAKKLDVAPVQTRVFAIEWSISERE
jgi:superfamily II DNA or RNA helicase